MVTRSAGIVRERKVAVALSLLHHHHRAIVAGVVRLASTKGNWVVATNQTVGLPLFEEANAEQFDGIIAGIHPAIWEKRVPTVYVGTPWNEMPGPTVAVDNAAVGHLAAEHLISLGVKQFAFVGVENHIWCHQRLTGFRAALGADGKDCRVWWLQRLGFLPEGEDARGFCKWLASMPKPCGLFGADDSIAASSAIMSRLAGLLIPRDVAIIGANNDDVCCLGVSPPLSSVIVPANEVGYEAGRWLDRAMSGERLPRTVLSKLLPTGVVQRGSTEVLGFDDPIVCEAIRLIRSRAPHEMLSTKQIATDLRISRRQLDRTFSATMGCSPKDEIDRIRIDRLQTLLANPQYPLKRIAREMGFVGSPDLSRFCRRVLSGTPAEIREQLQLVQK